MKNFDYSSQETKTLVALSQQDPKILEVFANSDYLFNALNTSHNYRVTLRDFLLPNPQHGVELLEASFVGYLKHHNNDEGITHLMHLLAEGLTSDEKRIFDCVSHKLNNAPFSVVLDFLINKWGVGFLDGFLTQLWGEEDATTGQAKQRKWMNFEESEKLTKLLPFIKDKYFSEQIVEYITSYATLMALDHLLIHEHVRKAYYLALKNTRDKNIRELNDEYWKKRTPHFWAMLQKEIIVGELGQLDKGERCTKKM